MTDWLMQMLVWGWAVDAHNDVAVLAETGDPSGGGRGPWWDRTAADLSFSRIDRGYGWEPAPDWWALAGRPRLVLADTT